MACFDTLPQFNIWKVTLPIEYFSKHDFSVAFPVKLRGCFLLSWQDWWMVMTGDLVTWHRYKDMVKFDGTLTNGNVLCRHTKKWRCWSMLVSPRISEGSATWDVWKSTLPGLGWFLQFRPTWVHIFDQGCLLPIPTPNYSSFTVSCKMYQYVSRSMYACIFGL